MSRILKVLLVIAGVTVVTGSHAKKKTPKQPEIVYQSKSLVVSRLSAHAYLHTSYLQTQDYGNVPCNGLIVTDGGETIIFDTPTNDSASEELITWIRQKLHDQVKAVIPTHFHNDCLGGLQAFHNHNIPSYAYVRTIELAKTNHYVVPVNSFSDSLVLKAGKLPVTARFFGEGHTRDNVVGYFPADHVMFGGCLVKELDATKGYLGDANVNAWSGTVEKVRKQYPDVKIVIPGHGDCGDKALLDYTIRLFAPH